MQTFDQALFDLFNESIISYDNALAFAESKNDLRLMIKLQDDSKVERRTSVDFDMEPDF